jgi:ketosteroid isomerase-like protein
MTPDERAVLAAMDALDETLDRHDADAFAAMFVDDPAATFWGSAVAEEAVGRDRIRALLASAEGSGTFTLSYGDRRVTILGDVAWVNASGEATWERPGLDTQRMPYRLTAILVRDGEVWRWHTHHGSEPSRYDG